MASAVLRIGRVRGATRAASWDALLIALAGAHAVVLALWPAWAVIAMGVWWNSNTIAHNFVHRAFFRTAWANAAFRVYLSMLLGIPQTLWRERHLAHHRGAAWRPRWTAALAVDAAAVLVTWTAIALANSVFFVQVYAPGYLVGLGLCWLQGHYEHARGTTSHYGRLYNFLLFNDGYHAEHHAHPGLHWTDLPERADPLARRSRWPAPLRGLDALSLEGLERLALRWAWLRRWVVERHRQAIAGVLPAAERVVIVGGGLFPRTALILRDLLPHARLTILEADAGNLERAREVLEDARIEFVHGRYHGQDLDCDLLVIPLAFQGDREALYRRRGVLIHDWLWRRRGTSRIVSRSLLKRVNLV